MTTVADAEEIAVEVLAERDRQDRKWGEQNHIDGTGPQSMPLLLVYSDGDVRDDDPAARLSSLFQAETDEAARVDAVAWIDILLEEVFEASAEEDFEKLRAELIQVAAVAQQWVQAIDRRGAVS